MAEYGEGLRGGETDVRVTTLWRRALLALAVLLALVLLAGALVLQQLRQAGVQVAHWQGLAWRGGALQLGELQLNIEQPELSARVHVQQLVLRPQWPGDGLLREVQIGHLRLHWDPLPPPQSEPAPLPDPREWLAALGWLPQGMQIAELQLELPCAGRRCLVEGALHSQRTGQQMHGQLQAHSEGLQLQGDWRLQVQAQGWQLGSNWQLDGREALQMHADWQQSAADRAHWQGWLRIPDWPGSPQLMALLGLWLPQHSLPLADLPEGLQMTLGWDWQGERWPQQPAELLQQQLQLGAQVVLEQPAAIPGLGELRGEQRLSLSLEQGRWQLHEGRGEWILQPQTGLLDDWLPDELQPRQLTLVLQAQDQALDGQQALALDVQLQLQGPWQASLQGPLMLGLLPDWQIAAEAMRLELQADSLQFDDLRLQGLRVQALAGLQLDANALQLQLQRNASLQLGVLQLAPAELRLQGLRAGLAGSRLSLPLAEAAASWRLPLQVRIDSLQHPLLQTQSWQLDGELSGAADMQLRARLHNPAGLAAELDWRWPAKAAGWQAALELVALDFAAGNPLAASLADWPPLLSLSAGSLRGQGQLHGSSGLDRASFLLQLDGGAGIYDRSSFSGLQLPLQLSLNGEQLQLQVADMQLAQIDPGLPLGPLQLAAHYHANLAAPLAGELQLQLATLQALGAQISVTPQRLQLGEDEQLLELQLSGLELAGLLEVYPTEGLYGDGLIDGRLPLRLSAAGPSISDGWLRARSGGVLQYRTPALAAMGRGNPAMAELALALDDFRYTLLQSDLEYAPDGRLQLGLRLEGANPKLQGGRPVHLNINLEEDIPALLTSLQLSGQLSEIIRKRVEQRVLQQRLQP